MAPEVKWIKAGRIFQVMPGGRGVVVFPEHPGQLKAGMELHVGEDRSGRLRVKLPSYTRVECSPISGTYKKGDPVYVKAD